MLYPILSNTIKDCPMNPHSLSVSYMGVPKMCAKQNVIIVPSPYPSNGIKVCATLSGSLSFVISKRQKVTEGSGETPHLFKVKHGPYIKKIPRKS